MATKSIFDCENLDARSPPERQQITYDDEDIFGFGCEEANEIDAAPKNVSISVTFGQDENNGQKNGKRKARDITKLDNGRMFKVAKTNVPSIKVTSNGAVRRAVESGTCDEDEDEDYTMLKKIGSGTYGTVYKARWKLQGKLSNDVIAIKRIVCKMSGPRAVNILKS